MNMHESFGPFEEMVGRTRAPHTSWLGSVQARFARLFNRCADDYAAAAAYDDLCRLSDAQLRRRGLSRDILARDLSGWRDRAWGN
ncbi:MAG: hypothetical protein F9K29_19855 [Hyphomicrobiaceae bacterium]|nr:MAG: hypothetical protein F9K29_19855 [Hyphomicrobiaceae bacterium]